MKQARTILLALLGLVGGYLSPSWAADVTLSARYLGDADGQFENTTPKADFCTRWPSMCNRATVDLPISFLKTTTRGAADPRDRLFVKVPARRTVTVVNQSTLDSYLVTLEFQEFSLELQRVRGTPDVPIFNMQGGCMLRAANSHNLGAIGRFLWSVSNVVAPQPCYSDSSSGTDGEEVQSSVGLAGTSYRLIMPRPIGMPQGTYRGSTQFTVGADGDFAFGNNVSNLNDPILTVHLELDVRHDLYLRFPPVLIVRYWNPREAGRATWGAWPAAETGARHTFQDLVVGAVQGLQAMRVRGGGALRYPQCRKPCRTGGGRRVAAEQCPARRRRLQADHADHWRDRCAGLPATALGGQPIRATAFPGKASCYRRDDGPCRHHLSRAGDGGV